MKKILAIMMCCAGGLLCMLLSSCGLPAEAPPGVTDPQVRTTFYKAKANDGESLYKVAQYYEEGSNGFPKSSWHATARKIDASYAGYPPAMAEYGYDKWKKSNLGSNEEAEARALVLKAAQTGDQTSLAYWKEIEAVETRMRKEREAANREFEANKCQYCNGTGIDPVNPKTVWETRNGFGDVVSTQSYTKPCPHCLGTKRENGVRETINDSFKKAFNPVNMIMSNIR